MISNTVKYLLLFIICFEGFAQTNADSLILYKDGFRFSDGVFPSFENVRRNDPIPKGRILSEYSYDRNDFFEQILSKKNFFYYDQLGNKLSMNSRKVWGFSLNGNLYIKVGSNFSRITLIGNISHFIAYQTVESYNYSSPYYNPYYPNYPYYNPTPSTSTVMQQYLLDFKTGQLLIYDVEAVEVLLMRDPELHDEYVQLSKKKKKQMKFLYIRKFNERNPLYLIKK